MQKVYTNQVNQVLSKYFFSIFGENWELGDYQKIFDCLSRMSLLWLDFVSLKNSKF